MGCLKRKRKIKYQPKIYFFNGTKHCKNHNYKLKQGHPFWTNLILRSPVSPQLTLSDSRSRKVCTLETTTKIFSIHEIYTIVWYYLIFIQFFGPFKRFSVALSLVKYGFIQLFSSTLIIIISDEHIWTKSVTLSSSIPWTFWWQFLLKSPFPQNQ